MPTQERREKNLALNRFMGWEPGQKCYDLNCPLTRHNRCWGIKSVHNIPSFNYYADTPEAHERTRLLKDEYVRRTGEYFRVHSWRNSEGDLIYNASAHVESMGYARNIESHAVLDAIYEAIKTNLNLRKDIE